MNEFRAPLRGLASRLSIPEPARSRVLLEISADMEGLLEHYLAQGLERAEAVTRVTEQFDLSEEALREMVRLHSSPFRHSLEALTSQVRSPWEQGLLLLVALVVAPGLLYQLLEKGVLTDAGPVAFVLLPLLLVALGLGLWSGVSLFRPGAALSWGSVSAESRTQTMVRGRRAFRSLPNLALLLLGVGLAGAWIDLYRAALVVRAAPELALRPLVHWVHAASASLVVALAGALLTGLLWFFLEARAETLEQRAASRLMEPES